MDRGYIIKIVEKYKSLSTPAKAAAWFTICNIIQRGIQFICMPVYTRIMPAEEYGIYTIFMSWANLFSIFTSLGIYGNVFNKAMIKFERERKQYISSVQWMTTLCAGCLAIVFVVLKKCKINVLGMQGKQICLMIIYLLFFPTLQYWYQEQRFEFKYKALVSVTLFNSLTSIIFGLVGVFFLKEKGFALIGATVLAHSIVGVILFAKIAFSGKTVYNHDYWKWSLKLALPLIPSSLSEILLGHADRIMIRYMCNASAAAIYTTVYQLSMVMAIIRIGINGAYIPWLYYSLQSKTYRSIKTIINLIIILFGGLTTTIMILGPELMKIAAPENYYEAVDVIPAIMLGCFFVSLYYIFEQIEFYYEKVIFSSFASVFGAVLNIVLNLICIKRAGYLVAGYTTMITYMVMAMMHTGYVLYLGGKSKEIKKIFNFKFLFTISGLLIGTGFGCLKLYKIEIIYRFAIILCLILCIYWNKRKIYDLISQLKKVKNE